MKFKLLAGAALAAAFVATGASAQEGWYGAIDLGYHWPEGIEAKSSVNASNGSPYRWTFDQEKDWTGFVRLGYQVNPHWRVELEGGYRPGDIDAVRGDPANNAIIGLRRRLTRPSSSSCTSRSISTC
jgi:OOP family OmpA-OmpF porin